MSKPRNLNLQSLELEAVGPEGDYKEGVLIRVGGAVWGCFGNETINLSEAKKAYAWVGRFIQYAEQEKAKRDR